MVDGNKKLSESLTNLLAGKQDVPQQFSGVLGTYDTTGRPTVIVPNRPDYVWVRIRGNESEPVQAFNETVSPVFDLPVIIERDAAFPNRWVIKGRDINFYDTGEGWNGRPYLPSHGVDHSFAGGAGTGGDIVWVYKRQFMPMLPRPMVSGTTFGVYVEAGYYHHEGQYNWWPGSGIAGFESYLPSGGANARYVTVSLNPNTGVLIATQGEEFASDTLGDLTDYIPMPAEGNIPLAAVYMVTGARYAGWGEIYDLRWPTIRPPSTSGSVTYIYEDGSFKGAVTTLDYRNNMNVSVSGSRAYIESEGGVGNGISGVSVYEDSVFEGTVGHISFNENLTLTVSGAYAFIDAAGAAGGNGISGVSVYEDSVFEGTVGHISFDDNLNLTVSGAYAFIDAAGSSSIPFVARAHQASQSSFDNNYSVIDYDTVDEDPDGTITTGSAWEFEVPADGVYSFKASFGVQSGAEYFFRIRVNSTAVRTINLPGVSTWNSNLIIYSATLSAGDVVDFQARKSTAGSANSVTTYTWFEALYWKS